MENALKALLIAGSVLIVILVIAMGMRVFNSTSGTTDLLVDTMGTVDKAMINSKFTSYIGKNKSAAQVKSLANVIITHNANKDAEEKVFLEINEASQLCHTINPNGIMSALSNLTGNKYNISAYYKDGNDGRLVLKADKTN